MNIKDCIDQQIKSNQSKNLFNNRSYETLCFIKSTIDTIHKIDEITKDEKEFFINYATEKTLQEFCRVNQYFAYKDIDKNLLKEIYTELLLDIEKKEVSIETISNLHYKNLKLWLEITNPFSKELYQNRDSILEPIACFEYSENLQKRILHINNNQLLEPILDIGCGKEGNLVKSLREDGFNAFGIDRFSDNSLYVKNVDWLEYDYGIEKWGTVISNLGFSNHFIHNHLRKDGNFVEYAKKYMEILKSLKVGARFYYAPDLPFIEKYLDDKKYDISKYDIESLDTKTTIIKRLN